jgi:hypothetical protein
MASWVEEFITADIRIVGVLNERPLPGVESLTYWIERNGCPDRGPFITFEAAENVTEELLDPGEQKPSSWSGVCWFRANNRQHTLRAA